MAFTSQEIEILKKAKQAGKTKEQALAELALSRRSVSPTNNVQAEDGAMADLRGGFGKAKEIVQSGIESSVAASERPSLAGRLSGQLGAGFKTAGGALASLGEGAFRAIPGGTTVADTVEETTGAALETVASQPGVRGATQFASEQFGNLPEGVQQTVRDVGDVILGGVGIGGTLVAPGVTNTAAKTALRKGDDILTKVRSKNTVSNPGVALNTIQDRIKNVRFNLSDVDPQTETALQRSSFDEVNQHFQLAKQAAKDTQSQTPLEIVGNQAEEAFQTIKQATSKAVEGKNKILNEVGDQQLPNTVVQNTFTDANNRMSNRFGVSITPNGEIRQVQGRLAQLDGQDEKLVTDYFTKLNSLGETPSVKEVDDFIDWAQSQLYKQTKTVSRLDAADEKIISELKQITGSLNTELKNVVGNGYAEVNARISRLLDMQDEISRGLGADNRKGGGFVKRLFSPTGGNTRRIFEDIRQITGIDLDKQANLAKFAMESVGDTRQKSLLQNLGVAAKEAETISLTEPLSIINFIRERADLDAQELANEIIRRQKANQ